LNFFGRIKYKLHLKDKEVAEKDIYPFGLAIFPNSKKQSKKKENKIIFWHWSHHLGP